MDSTEKFDCPECKQHNRFRRYLDKQTGEYLMKGDYGICDRENSCGYQNLLPEDLRSLTIKREHSKVDEKEDASVLSETGIDEELIKEYKNNYYHISKLEREYVECPENCKTIIMIDEKHFKYKNNFVRSLYKIFGKNYGKNHIKKVVMDQLKLMTFFDGAVMFPYYDVDGKLITAKIMFYDNDLKRKRVKGAVMWLHNFRYKGEYLRYETLIDASLLDGHVVHVPFFNQPTTSVCDETICLVESEKTVVIMSIVLPEYRWVATGGSKSVAEWKFALIQDINLFPDISKDDAIKIHWESVCEEMDIEYKSIDFIPPSHFINEYVIKRDVMGDDIADFVLEIYKEEGYDALQNYLKHIKKQIDGN